MRGALTLPAAIVLTTLACPSATLAEEQPRVDAALESDRVFLGETTRLRISVHGVRNAKPPPDGAFGKDLAVRFAGGTDVSQERFRFEGGREFRESVRAYVMDFELRPLRAGRLRVPSVDVTAAGETLTTKPLPLTVVGPSESRNARVTLSPSREWAYVEQEVRLVLRVQLRKARLDGEKFEDDPWNPRSAPQLSIPWFESLQGFEAPDTERWMRGLLGGRDGFRVNGLVEETLWSTRPLRFRFARRERLIDGEKWFEYEIAKRVVPTSVGTSTIPPTTLRGELLTDLERRGRALQATGVEDVFIAHEPVQLEVRPVPTAGRPPTYAHAIGLYEAFATLEPARGKVGDPLRLALTVQGSGLIGNVTAPRLGEQADLVGDFAIAESTEPSETDGAAKTFHYVVRPRRADVDALPPLEFAFFDPREESFRLVRTTPIPVEVEEAVSVGASEVVQAGGGADAVSTPGEEVAGGLLGNAALDATLADESEQPLSDPLVLVLLLGPPLVLVLAAFAALRERRRSGDPLALRERNALVTARAVLDEAARHLGGGDEAQATAALHRALAGYVADRSRVPAAAMTATDVRQRFDRYGVRSPAATAVADALEACEAARYGGASEGLADHVAAAAQWLAALERETLR